MIRSLYRAHDGNFQTNLAPDDLDEALADKDGLLWLDLVEEPPQSCERLMREKFHFHPLAIDDALQETHVPKIDDWGAYLYLVLHAVIFDLQADDPIQTLELDTFLGRNYVVTYQAHALTTVERVWTLCQRDRRYLEKQPPYLMYKLADELVADYMPVAQQIDDIVDQIEDSVFANPRSADLETIFSLKRSLLSLRRILAPQREVLNKLARGDFPVMTAEDRVFFRDVYDHLVRLYDISESLRDLVGSALDTYLSVVNNRMNDVMKTLTLITTLFMPLTFVVGFFGMNFFHPVLNLAGWTGRVAFGVTMAAMLFMPFGMYLWMRRRAWL
jgi:magnesium transporter